MNALFSSPHSGPSEVPAPAPAGQLPPRTKELRLRKHADYQRVYHASRKQFSTSMTWFLSPQPVETKEDEAGPASSKPAATPRVGLTAGKVLGKAHERNRIKRRMREAVRRHIGELPAGVDLVLHPKRSVLTVEFAKLEAEIVRIFKQAAAQVSGQRSAYGPAPQVARGKA